MARAIICGKPEMRIGEIAIVATLKSELPLATLWSTEGRPAAAMLPYMHASSHASFTYAS